MKFEDALKKYDGESVGGQVIVAAGVDRICIGKHLDGQFLPDHTPEAEAYMAAIDKPKLKPEAEATEQSAGRRRKSALTAEAEPVVEPEPEPEPVVEPEPEAPAEPVVEA